ncbi:hypothetical protein Moror_5264 [Moniliophthora roreri MCA 2997]|uniref:NadR/Ttd14 AAA domain-containing protein n=2 Tax=Moniliophthora roreri TaxID=221103 RepID=V2X5V9_MONRO|nr:hypothetical protein Moror_5264 [Moniliophthora roreri MCA 2997]
MRPRRIYIIGPSSTGKTTLCKALSQRLSLPPSAHITEVARHVIKSHGWTRKDIGLVEMQQAILDAHVAREMEMDEDQEVPSVLLSDRSAVDPIVYAVFTAAAGGEKDSSSESKLRKEKLVNSPAFQSVLPVYRDTEVTEVYLLEPVEEWLEDDGFRHVGDEKECLRIYREVLEELGIEYRVIGRDMMDLEERVMFVLNSKAA